MKKLSKSKSLLTVNGSDGAWSNDGGTFNPNTSNVIFTNTNATFSGTTNFYDVTINSAKALSLTSGSIMRIAGTMTNNGTWNVMIGGPATVEYNGGSQVVINPNGGTPGYYNLTLSGSGTKTTSGITVNGILSMEGTATASIAPTYGQSASLRYNTATSCTAGSEWITLFTAGGGIIIANTGIIFLDESKVLNASVPLTINSGVGLTIGPLYSLTVNGSITNNAGPSGLVIQSSSGSDGKLMNNTSSVPATVELSLSGGSSYFHFFVPPVSAMAIGSTLQDVKGNLGLANFNNDLMSYSESAAGGNQNLGWQYYDGYTGRTGFPSAPFTSLVSSKGYNIYLTAEDIITFKGTLNATPHSFSLTRSVNCLGWNLVGNPYPCNYDLAGCSALTTTDNGVDKSIYFTHNGNYAVWNLVTHTGTSGYSDIVPPMQGFFVHVTASGNSLTFPAGSKTTSDATPRSKGPGTYKIDATEFENPDGIKVILKHGPVETILSRNASYSFTSSAGTFTDFEIIIGSTPTVIDNLTGVKLKTWYSKNFLYINCPAEIISGKGNLIIYDMQGKLVLSNNQLYFTPGQTLQLPSHCQRECMLYELLLMVSHLHQKLLYFN